LAFHSSTVNRIRLTQTDLIPTKTSALHRVPELHDDAVHYISELLKVLPEAAVRGGIVQPSDKQLPHDLSADLRLLVNLLSRGGSLRLYRLHVQGLGITLSAKTRSKLN